MEYIVRIESIELENFKNVGKGTISILRGSSPVEKLKSLEKDNLISNVVGIYGQNGSGKTSVVESLYFLKNLLSGESLDDDCYNYIQQGKDKLKCNFNLFLIPKSSDKPKMSVNYSFEIVLLEDKQFEIQSELLKYNAIYNDGTKSLGKIIDYDRTRDNYFSSFMTADKLRVLKNNSKEDFEKLKAYLLVHKNPRASFIFNNENFDILINVLKNDIYISDTIKSLKKYAEGYLFVFRNEFSARNMEGEILQLSYSRETNKARFLGELFYKYGDAPNAISEDKFDAFERIINNLNIVLKTIIPNMIVTIKKEGEVVLPDGKTGIKVFLCSNRNGVEFPLKYESDGIKKILSILGIVIDMYNNPSVTLVVDELDSGIFEYLLGELVKIIDDSGSGQLLFTSHNLRPLELLNYKSLFFTTVNPKNRYTQLTSIKANNNIRDVYYTNIQLGSINDDLYEMVDSFTIKNALYEAGLDAEEING